MATESRGEEEVATAADGADAARLRRISELEVDKEWLREVGKNAAWTVSSFKPGNGVSCLLDSNLDTFWQNPVPHQPFDFTSQEFQTYLTIS